MKGPRPSVGPSPLILKMAAVCVSQKSGGFSGKAVVFKGQLSPGGHIPHRAQLSAEARADTSDVY